MDLPVEHIPAVGIGHGEALARTAAVEDTQAARHKVVVAEDMAVVRRAGEKVPRMAGEKVPHMAVEKVPRMAGDAEVDGPDTAAALEAVRKVLVVEDRVSVLEEGTGRRV